MLPRPPNCTIKRGLGVAAAAAGLDAAEGEPLGATDGEPLGAELAAPDGKGPDAGLDAANGEPPGAELDDAEAEKPPAASAAGPWVPVAATGDAAAPLAAPAAVGWAGVAPLHAEPTSAIAHATNTRLTPSIDHLTSHRPSTSTRDGRPMLPMTCVPLLLTSQGAASRLVEPTALQRLLNSVAQAYRRSAGSDGSVSTRPQTACTGVHSHSRR
ncbi:MAG: hypothetical protein JOZ87_16555 [Chloroflexi bacterium]|nr:hypothetical protein [Chloroflexota bacterium]